MRILNPTLPEYSIADQIAAFQAVKDTYPSSIEAQQITERIFYLQKRQRLLPTQEMQNALLPIFRNAWRNQALGYRYAAVSSYNLILDSPFSNNACKAEAQLQKAGLLFEIAKGEDVTIPRLDPGLKLVLLQQTREECQKTSLYSPDAVTQAIAALMTFETYYYENDYSQAIQQGMLFSNNTNGLLLRIPAISDSLKMSDTGNIFTPIRNQWQKTMRTRFKAINNL